jgi:hypothetical protein
MVCYPSEKYFKNVVSSNIICNCPVTLNYISAANHIFVPNIASIKGKTVQVTQDPILMEYVEVPKEIVDLNKDITITADGMLVDGLGFLITSS